MSVVHFDQLTVNAAVSHGVTSGESFQKIVGSLSDPWGLSLHNLSFLQQ